MEPKKLEFTNSVFSYIDEHYKRWIDFAAYHCSKAGRRIDLFRLMSDIQNEVLSLKTKRIARLMFSMSGNYTRLDLFVLRSIKDRIYGLKIDTYGYDFSQRRVLNPAELIHFSIISVTPNNQLNC